jgi:glucose 1-dehydrogenase
LAPPCFLSPEIVYSHPSEIAFPQSIRDSTTSAQEETAGYRFNPGLVIREALPLIGTEPPAGLARERDLADFMEEAAIDKKLSGKTALVTGSSQGIGEGIAIRLAEEGADVIVNYFGHQESANSVVERIKESGVRSIAIGADISNVEQSKNLILEGAQKLGGVDILVNNAGIELRADFWNVTEDDFDRVLDVNLKGAFFTAQAFVQYLMKAKRPGKIINISSVHEELPFPHFSPYCVSKGGLKMMTRTLAIELAPYGITINSVAPGAIETPINKRLLNDPAELKGLLGNIPLKRLGEPQDVAGTVAFLASRDADYITGATIVVDGGLLWNYEEQ